MIEISSNGITAKFELKNIDILKSNLTVPEIVGLQIPAFQFDLRSETKLNIEQKLVFVIITVFIKSEDGNLTFAEIKISLNFYIENFNELITFNEGQLPTIEPFLFETFNS